MMQQKRLAQVAARWGIGVPIVLPRGYGHIHRQQKTACFPVAAVAGVV